MRVLLLLLSMLRHLSSISSWECLQPRIYIYSTVLISKAGARAS